MELVKKKLTEIKPYENNPRENDAAVEAVMQSIQQCDYINPMIVDENGIILAGHTRYKALKKLGYDECEVVVKSGLTESQKKKFRLLDNKTNELSEWDFERLEKELEDLDFEDLDLIWLPEDETLAIDQSERDNGNKRIYLAIGKTKIELSQDEFEKLMNLYNNYCDSEGTNYGFGFFLASGH